LERGAFLNLKEERELLVRQCGVLYCLAISARGKAVSCKARCAGNGKPFSSNATPQMTAYPRARRETHKCLNPALQFLARGLFPANYALS